MSPCWGTANAARPSRRNILFPPILFIYPRKLYSLTEKLDGPLLCVLAAEAILGIPMTTSDAMIFLPVL
jgi:hypothetical protein